MTDEELAVLEQLHAVWTAYCELPTQTMDNDSAFRTAIRQASRVVAERMAYRAIPKDSPAFFMLWL
jgi:hypothetical protein